MDNWIKLVIYLFRAQPETVTTPKDKHSVRRQRDLALCGEWKSRFDFHTPVK